MTGLPDVFAERLRAARKARGMTVPKLAEACKDADFPGLTTPSITNLERPPSAVVRPGRRAGVDEWLALAHVLQVPPVALLLPLGRPAATVQLVPGIETPIRDALAWLTTTDPQGLDGNTPDDATPWYAITHLRQTPTQPRTPGDPR